MPGMRYAAQVAALRRLRWAALVLALLLVLPPGLLLAARPALMAPQPAVFFDPQPATIGLGLTQTVDLVIRDVSGLYAAEIILTYDPTLVEVQDAQPSLAGVQIEPGPLFPASRSYVIRNQVDPSLGQISFMITLTSTGDSLPDGGILARLRLRALRAGSGSLHFAKSLLCNAAAIRIDAPAYDGVLQAVAATSTPTRTGTATLPPSLEPPAPTATPSATPTNLLTVYCEPSTQIVPAGTTGSFDIDVVNATNLVGVILHLSFDPSLLSIQSVTVGGFFAGPDWQQVYNAVDPATGTISYQGMLSSGLRSGAGTVLRVTFSALREGTSPLTFGSTMFIQPGAMAAPPVLYHGQVVVSAPAATCTATPSATPSLTPSSTPSNTPSATPTPGTPTITPSPSATPAETPSPTPTHTVTPGAPLRLAYIYDTDMAAALSFQSLLDTSGLPTDLIPLSAVWSTDLSPYRTLLIGPDTGYTSDWGDAGAVSAVDLSGKPVLGLGKGGYAFFGKLGLNIGFPYGTYDSQSQILAVAPWLSIFSSPNAISLPGDRILTLYSTTGDVMSIGLPSLPAGLLAIGRDADSPGSYQIVQEGSRFLLWGFAGSPDAMTTVGRQLFVNAVHIPVTVLATPTPTASPSATPTATASPSPTPTASATPSPSPSRTPSPSVSPTPTVSVTPSAIPVPQQVILQDGLNGYTGTADSYLHGDYVSTKYGAASDLQIRSVGARRPLIRFDLSFEASKIPPGATITQARLQMRTNYYRNKDAEMVVELYQLRRPWVEGEVTWNNRSDGSPWQVGGADSTALDRYKDMATSATLKNTDTWYTWEITSLVQDWLNTPSSNFGLLFYGRGSSIEYRFWSADCSAPSLRPKLIIDYLAVPLPTATPTLTPSLTSTPTNTLTPTPVTPGAPTATPTDTPTPTTTPSPTIGPIVDVFQEGSGGYAGTLDTYIDSWNPDRNRSGDVVLIIRQGGIRKTLLRFDLMSIPSAATVTQATLSLYITGRSNANAMTVTAYRVLRNWAETQATWNQASDGGRWGLPGCSQINTDRAGAASGTASANSVGTWLDVDITGLVQQWVNTPGSNLGLLLEGSGPTSVEYTFASADQWWRLDQAPRLTVAYQ